MGDGTGVALATLEPAALAELKRIIRDSEAVVGQSYASSNRAYLYRIIRDVHPDMDRALWTEITGRAPDASRDAAEQRRAEREQQRVRAAWVANRDLLRQHGRPTCCEDCDQTHADALRQELAGQGVLVDAPAPVQPDEDEDDAPERTCECDGCDGTDCQGNCPPCTDHECGQCFPDGCPEDELSECCGECGVCDRHPNGANGDDVCDRGHCHECEHHCD